MATKTSTVVPDVPPLGDLFHPEAIVTSRIGYLRLHSRNAAQWYAGGVQRYDYDYSDAELAAICGVWSPLAEGVDCVFVFFNNCRHGQAAKNTRRFVEIAQANRGTGATLAGFAVGAAPLPPAQPANDQPILS